MQFRVFLLLSFLNVLVQKAAAQYFLGLRSSQFGGVTNVSFNPAIAGDRHRFDMTLFGVAANVGNNYIGIDPKVGLRKDYVNSSLDFQETYLRERLNGRDKHAYVGAQVQGPLSFMFTFGKRKESHKNALAFTWNINAVVNADRISQKLARISYWGVGFKADSIDKFNYIRLKEGDVRINALSWIDYGITYSREILNKNNHYLKAGGTFKFIQGIMGLNTFLENVEYRWQNFDTISIYDSRGALEVNSVAPTTKEYFERDHAEDIYGYVKDALSFIDRGISFAGDLAVVYEWRPRQEKYKYKMDGREWYDIRKNLHTLQVGFSVTDIGRIKFRKSEYSYEFNLNKQDWYVKDFSPNEGIKSFGDTIRLTEGFDIINTSKTKPNFYVWLPTRFNLWFDYNPVHFFGLHALASVAPRLDSRRSVHHISTFTVTPHLDWRCLGLYLPVSYDVLGNFNVGSTVRIGPIIVGTSDFLALAGAKKFAYNADVHVALKIPVLPKKHRDRDKDFVSNREDKCKREKGTWESRGCPDRDLDGVLDKDDKCPDVPGLRDLQGCPDRDADGVTDAEDECPDDKGIVALKGCPDADGDSIPDKNDECPDQAGVAALKGCPDRDGDGVADKNDDCVDVPGDIAHKGCPDSDGDGLYDNEDDCPRQAGPKENKGCPYKDSDGDGVLDKDDACPNTFGVVENRGCPKIEKKELDIIKYAFENLEFETGKDVIRPSSYISLNSLAKLLIDKPQYGLKIEGHTDSDGDDQFNLILSQKRAEAVKRYLIGRGVDGSKLETEGFGETRPIADNKTKEGKQKNRRVEMKIIFK
ncbi:MAG: DUF5723 family protein [Chitinophagales bacterium]|nr:DUF5723 family protein [Chitinophagales bacterium]MDW8273197.1 DUF5723 family protein [Chitinophagales bacterium]